MQPRTRSVGAGDPQTLSEPGPRRSRGRRAPRLWQRRYRETATSLAPLTLALDNADEDEDGGEDDGRDDSGEDGENDEE